MPGKKVTARGWSIDIRNDFRGWQNSKAFMEAYPTPTSRRDFYKAREHFYQDVRDGTLRQSDWPMKKCGCFRNDNPCWVWD